MENGKSQEVKSSMMMMRRRREELIFSQVIPVAAPHTAMGESNPA